MSNWRKKIKYAFLVRLVKLLIWIASWLPESILRMIFKFLSIIAYLIVSKARNKCKENLKIAYPDKTDKEVSKMAKQVFINLSLAYATVTKSVFIKTKEAFMKKFEVKGSENLRQAYKKGQGVLLVMPHLGAYELIGLYAGLNYPSMAVGAKLKNPELNKLMVKYRTQTGSEYISRDENPIKLVRALKSGYVVGVLVDQDTNKVKNVFVDFFGKLAATPVGPATLQRKIGATVVPSAVIMENGRHILHFGPELPMVKSDNIESDLILNTQTMLDSSEEYIRKFPTQWVWFHDRWKTRPESELP